MYIISNKVINTIINMGKRLKITRPFDSILKANPDKIANNKCPADILAASTHAHNNTSCERECVSHV